MKVKTELTDIVCRWAHDEEYIWSTECGNFFQFDADGQKKPALNFARIAGTNCARLPVRVKQKISELFDALYSENAKLHAREFHRAGQVVGVSLEAIEFSEVGE